MLRFADGQRHMAGWAVISSQEICESPHRRRKERRRRRVRHSDGRGRGREEGGQGEVWVFLDRRPAGEEMYMGQRVSQFS